MTKQEKEKIDIDIVNLFSWIKQGDVDNSILYMRGDNEFKIASIIIKGDVMLLANTLIHHIEQNPEFGRFILAVIGSYLSKNPDKEKEFLEGLTNLKSYPFSMS